jgi:hypothetical protein
MAMQLNCIFNRFANIKNEILPIHKTIGKTIIIHALYGLRKGNAAQSNKEIILASSPEPKKRKLRRYKINRIFIALITPLNSSSTIFL